MAGVLSPFSPLFPPMVRWRLFLHPVTKSVGLNSWLTFHSFPREHSVVRREPRTSSCSSAALKMTFSPGLGEVHKVCRLLKVEQGFSHLALHIEEHHITP